MELEKMRREIEEMQERLDEIKAERVAKGLPADPPEDFLPVPLSGVMAERLTDTASYIAKYAKLTLDSKQHLAVNVEQLQEAKDMADLLRHSKGLFSGIFGMGIYSAIDRIEKVSLAVTNGEKFNESPKKIAESLYVYLKFAEGFKSSFHGDIYEQPEGIKLYDEYDRLKGDEALYKVELSRYQEHYASIKHLY